MIEESTKELKRMFAEQAGRVEGMALYCPPKVKV